MPVVRGTAYWASVTAPNTKFEPCWTVDLLLDKKTAQAINSACEELKDSKKDKLPVFKLDEEKGGYLVKIKQRCTFSNGKGANPPKVVMEDGTKYTNNVGNGSDISILYNIVRTEFKGQGYVSLFLRGVKIHNLVKFAAEEEEENFFGAPKEEAPKDEEEAFFDDDVPNFT